MRVRYQNAVAENARLHSMVPSVSSPQFSSNSSSATTSAVDLFADPLVGDDFSFDDCNDSTHSIWSSSLSASTSTSSHPSPSNAGIDMSEFYCYDDVSVSSITCPSQQQRQEQESHRKTASCTNQSAKGLPTCPQQSSCSVFNLSSNTLEKQLDGASRQNLGSDCWSIPSDSDFSEALDLLGSDFDFSALDSFDF